MAEGGDRYGGAVGADVLLRSAGTGALVVGLCLANVGTAVAEAPPPREGFQMHVVPMTEVTVPTGKATGASGDTLRGRYGPQWTPIEVGLGVKINPDLYVGAYLDTTVGPAGDNPDVRAQCTDNTADFDNDIRCSSSTFGVGGEMRYSFTPDERAAPWLGFGFGLSRAAEHIEDDRGYSETVYMSGINIARLGFGIDFRLAKGIGVGLFGKVAVGRYHRTRTVIGTVETFDGAITDPALHAWNGGGFRLVIMP